MKDRLNTLLSRLMGLCALSFILMAAGRMVGIAPMVATGMVLSGIATLPMPGIALKLAVSITQTDDLQLEGAFLPPLQRLARESCL